MWPGIIKYTRNRVGLCWSCGQVSLNIQELVTRVGHWWPGIINYTRTRVGHVARYH